MKTTTKTKLLALFVGVGMSIASAKSYSVSVPDNTEVAGTQIKAGDYNVKVDGATATLTDENTNKKVEASGAIQSSATKFSQTTLELSKGTDGQNHITAIDLGGTTTILTFAN